MEFGMDMAEERSHLVNGGRSNHGARRLLQVQRKHPPLLRQISHRRGFAPRSSVQPADRKLLQGRCRRLLGSGSLSRRLRFPGERRACRHVEQDGEAADELHAAGARSGIHLRPCQGRAVHHISYSRPSPENPSAHDLECDLHLLTVPSIKEPNLLCFTVILLQHHNHSLPQVCLWLPQQQQQQRRLEAARRRGNQHPEEGQRAAAPVHVSHVPDPRALAREAQLQGLLAGEDRHHELQLSCKLHPVDARCAAPEPRPRPEVFSFDYKPLSPYQSINDTGMFYGMKYFNDLLMEAGPSGNVQSEVLLEKNLDTFTLYKAGLSPERFILMAMSACSHRLTRILIYPALLLHASQPLDRVYWSPH
ncbi:COBRA-like protein 4 [Platanthera guangdongensis]|uniref:COBRA-like protein 4 n=1 Tax=Platanthera guangdongensis TaxID=2320717 RepID=A0ABR2M4M5_9ASPA